MPYRIRTKVIFGWLISECGVLCCGGEIVLSSKERVEETGI
jgi:hypothetical protein